MTDKETDLLDPSHLNLKPYNARLFVSAKRNTRVILSKDDTYPNIDNRYQVYDFETIMHRKWPYWKQDIPDDLPPIKTHDELIGWLEKTDESWVTKDKVITEVIPSPIQDIGAGVSVLSISKRYAALAKVLKDSYELWVFKFATRTWESLDFHFDAISGAYFHDGKHLLFVSTDKGVICIDVNKKPTIRWKNLKLLKTVEQQLVVKVNNFHVFVLDRKTAYLYILRIEDGHVDQTIFTTGLDFAVWENILVVGKHDGSIQYYEKPPPTEPIPQEEKTATLIESVEKKESTQPIQYIEKGRIAYIRDYVSVSGKPIKLTPSNIIMVCLRGTRLVIATKDAFLMDEIAPDAPRIFATNCSIPIMSTAMVGQFTISMLADSSVIIGLFANSTILYRMKNENYDDFFVLGRQLVAGSFNQMQALMRNGDIIIFKPTE